MGRRSVRLIRGVLGGQLSDAFSILEVPARKKVIFLAVGQILLGFLDLLGIAFVGALGALAVSGVQSSEPGNRVGAGLELLNLENQSLQFQVGALGIIAATALILRTIFSVYFTRKTLFFLSDVGASISSKLNSKLLSSNLMTIKKRSSQENLFSITAGVNNLVIGVIATSVSVAGDISLLIIISIGLLVVNPTIAIFSLISFSVISLILYRKLSWKAKELSFRNTTLTIQGNEKVLESLDSYREAYVGNRMSHFMVEFDSTRKSLARVQAEIGFLPYISKYLIEVAVVVGALVLSASQFLLMDASRAIGTLTVFLAAGTRIAPAILRIQQGAIQMKSSLGSIQNTLSLRKELENVTVKEVESQKLDLIHSGFVPSINISNISFTYPGESKPTISCATLQILPGEFVAIVGPSGAGKSTFTDLILGIITPDSGKVEISGLSASEAIQKWPGAISYVPQSVSLANSTISKNIALGFEDVELNRDQLFRVLEMASIDSELFQTIGGETGSVGENGNRLSGGQRQRIGIARALYTDPRLLVLDEATSSLDGSTEAMISSSLDKLKYAPTLVVVAHRLSTVKKADRIVYLSNGRIEAVGTLDEVRVRIPEFDIQAKLMGI
jgi:ATP-binding cassette subfamily C protein